MVKINGFNFRRFKTVQQNFCIETYLTDFTAYGQDSNFSQYWLRSGSGDSEMPNSASYVVTYFYDNANMSNILGVRPCFVWSLDDVD